MIAEGVGHMPKLDDIRVVTRLLERAAGDPAAGYYYRPAPTAKSSYASTTRPARARLCSRTSVRTVGRKPC